MKAKKRTVRTRKQRRITKDRRESRVTSDNRVLIVWDGTTAYVRRVSSTAHDGIRDEITYTCDLPIAGPLSLEDAILEAREYVKERD